MVQPAPSAIFKNGNANRIFIGQLISQACDKMMTIGLVWLFAQRYSETTVPWFLAVSALPHLLLARIAGPWTARWGQIRTLVGTDLFRGAVYVALAAIWNRVGPGGEIYFLFCASFVANLASALFNPAILSAPIAMVEEGLVQQLSALINLCFSLGNVAGPLLSAILYPWLGLRGFILFNGLSYWIAAFSEAGVTPVAVPAGSLPPAKPDSIGVILSRDKLVRNLLGSFLASNLFLTPLMVFLPLFVKSIYQGDIRTLSWLETVLGLGAVVGGIALSMIKLQSRQGLKIAACMLISSVGYLGFTLSSRVWVGSVCLGVLGIFLAATNVLCITFFQTRLEPRNVPTLMSVVNLISVASLPFSMVAVGLILGVAQIQTIALVCGVGLVSMSLAVGAQKQLLKVGETTHVFQNP